MGQAFQQASSGLCEMRVRYSPCLMLASMLLLNAGCMLRVSSEILSYESY